MSDELKSLAAACSRRRLLLLAAVAAGAATALGAGSRADTFKVSEGAAGYQDHPNGDKQCSECVNFLPPGSCKVVDGPISPHGYCRIFAPRQSASARRGVSASPG